MRKRKNEGEQTGSKELVAGPLVVPKEGAVGWRTNKNQHVKRER